LIDADRGRFRRALIEENVAGTVLLGVDGLLVRNDVVRRLVQNVRVILADEAEGRLRIGQRLLRSGVLRQVEVEKPAALIAAARVRIVDRSDRGRGAAAIDDQRHRAEIVFVVRSGGRAIVVRERAHELRGEDVVAHLQHCRRERNRAAAVVVRRRRFDRRRVRDEKPADRAGEELLVRVQRGDGSHELHGARVLLWRILRVELLQPRVVLHRYGNAVEVIAEDGPDDRRVLIEAGDVEGLALRLQDHVIHVAAGPGVCLQVHVAIEVDPLTGALRRRPLQRDRRAVLQHQLFDEELRRRR
jgi:hypothetical protein